MILKVTLICILCNYIESYAKKKMLKMFWVLAVLFVNLMSSRLFPVFVYKICVQLLYYTSLRHFSFQRYDGFSLKWIFQKIQKLEVIFEIFCWGKILFSKMSFNCHKCHIDMFMMLCFCSKCLILSKIWQLFIKNGFCQ